MCVQYFGCVLVLSFDFLMLAYLAIFTETEGKIGYALRGALHSHRLVVVEPMALRLDARMVNHGAAVAGETRHCTTDVTIDLHNLLHTVRFQEW
jgi:hypothetical protein